MWTRRNGRKSLLIGSTADRVVGLSDEESRALLDRLLDVVDPAPLRAPPPLAPGRPRDLGQHRPAPPGHPLRADVPRLMHRTTLVGEEAVA